MPRFVLLTHDHPVWHWDLMLEDNGLLRTWRLDDDPRSIVPLGATPLPDHRLLYLEYEGPVSNQRGTVTRWDRGDYEVIQETTDVFVVQLRGERIQGRAFLNTLAGGSVSYRFVPDSATPVA